MDTITLTINGKSVEAPASATILEAARGVNIYIPALCYHPDLPPASDCLSSQSIYQGDEKIENARPGEHATGCGLCVVEVKGEEKLVEACSTKVRAEMVVTTDSDRIRLRRQENLIPILARHPHACLTCAQQEGCSRTQCSTNVPENERCCPRFGHCELQDVANYIGISDATPKWLPTDLPSFKEDPLYVRDYNLCIGCTRCVRVCRDLRGVDVLGFVFDKNGQPMVGTLKLGLLESGCKYCTACVEVCPTGALMDKSVHPGKKEEQLVPCRSACPANIDVPGYVRLIAEGNPDKANAVIREKVPFPGILGRVCLHPCEEVCRRSEVNEPVSICALKRYAADKAKGNPIRVGKDSGKRIAIVGAGPAGLTAAFYLRKKGHSITLFDAKDRPGGMMRYGIPAYRLPRSVIDAEIKQIMDLGIDLRPNQSLGKDFTISNLKSSGYNAIFLATGAPISRRIEVEGSNGPDILWGIEFLEAVARDEKIRLKERVIVVGGGNVAIDVSLTARRCGAKSVTMVCLECQEEMPAHRCEIEEAVAEGVQILPSWGPHKILRENGRITGMELVQCTCVFDEKGNFCPEFGDSRQKIEADQVIMAAGQQTDLSCLKGEDAVCIENGRIVVDNETLQTDLQGVFAGGDVATTPGAVIHAIAAGRKAAASIDRALGGTGDIEQTLYSRQSPRPYLGRDENFANRPREKVPQLDMEQRHTGFKEISLGFTEKQAERESKRCLQCDLRLYLKSNPSAPAPWLSFDSDSVMQVPDTEGVYTLLDQEHKVLAIKGTVNLRTSLLDELKESDKAVWFEYEEDKMYSKRESELIQKYIQEHGEMPGGGDSDLDDLF
ncbi:MAG: FAD-dependent oxidoreductase [Deltaproteobacteria bacterium]|nr:FAD-dependent oxidoreductase [Deltaproteobacteria bacterium]